MMALGRRNLRTIVSGGAAILLFGGMAPGSSAQSAGAPELDGQWTAAFEEGGAGVPRCQPAGPEDPPGFVVCKPAAVQAAVLPDGRVMYYNGFESEENASATFGSGASTSPSSRNSQTRVLDLRSGVPEWTIPVQPRGGQSNPNIKEGHESPSDPLGMAGVPGRPGDGFVGSTWGQLGLPEHNPTSTPDDPAKNDGDLFCSDLTLLPDGRVLNVGGTDWYNEPAIMDRNNGDPEDVGFIELEGLRNATMFDYRTNSFAGVQPMKFGRWYPHLAMGPEGRPTVFGGVTKLIKSTQMGQVRRTETFDPATDTWTENYVDQRSENALPVQPRMILTPDGKFLFTSVGQLFGTNGVDAQEAMWSFMSSFDPEAKTWEIEGPAPLGARGGAFVVPQIMSPPYDKMDILIFGGTLGPTPSTNFATPLSAVTTAGADGNVTHRIVGTLNHARWYSSGVLLPDGQTVAVGGVTSDNLLTPGTELPVNQTEIYDPAKGTWREVVTQGRDRGYHSSALLLPDMRVLSGGNAPVATLDGGPNRDLGPMFANNDNDPSFEVWSPPYLFRGARPTITSAQAGVAWGEKFLVGTPQADEIESVLFLKLPSPEHINDSDQRGLRLEFQRTSDSTLEAVAPPSGKVAPPGFYYLVVNKKSPEGPIPSVARIVSIGAETDAAPAVQPFPDDNGVPVGGSATPDPDTSGCMKAPCTGNDGPSVGGVVGEAAQNAPVSGQAGAEESTFQAASSSRPTGQSRGPLLPMMAILGASVATFMGRRWFVSRTT